eukprot:CAMPEP_0198216366 /NCGR_PEP_ID=MMETSP1445-20131203/56981_1 /TAXON_ID=36898 /ORGANISM="Pyramimonas sp., Strain CCMP2087" /LENGTH=104 /DNA_ID=CAMNT_0043892565 /DNA_START=40 /DNA_END=350 /DNA_ORIENTATION=+
MTLPRKEVAETRVKLVRDSDDEDAESSMSEGEGEEEGCIKDENRTTVCGVLLVSGVALLMACTAALIMFWVGPLAFAPTCRKGGVLTLMDDSHLFMWSGEGVGG